MRKVYYKTEERKTSYESFMNWFNKLKNINFINGDTSDAIADRFEDDGDDKKDSILEKGDKVFLTENARCITGMPEGAEYEVKDIFYGDMTYNILLTSREYLGEGWEDYFSEDELIKVK